MESICPICQNQLRTYCVFVHCKYCDTELMQKEYSNLGIEDCYNCPLCNDLMELENCCNFKINNGIELMPTNKQDTTS